MDLLEYGVIGAIVTMHLGWTLWLHRKMEGKADSDRLDKEASTRRAQDTALSTAITSHTDGCATRYEEAARVQGRVEQKLESVDSTLKEHSTIAETILNRLGDLRDQVARLEGSK